MHERSVLWSGACCGVKRAVERACTLMRAESASQELHDAARDAREAKQRCGELRGYEAVRTMAEAATAQLQAVTLRQEQADGAMTAATGEIAHHRDGLSMLVETVENLTRDSQKAQDTLASRIDELERRWSPCGVGCGVV